MDKSYMVNVIDILKKSERNTRGGNYKVYAVVAPSISSQFSYANLGQVVTGLRKLGFHGVIEAALGADMVAMSEAREISEKGLLKLSKGALDGNFIEGMACVGGCIGGAGCLTHGEKSKTDVDKYGKEAL